jgi:hypothetical protein
MRDADKINKKIDQHYEMASLALVDGDYADAQHHYAEIKRLKQLLRE